MNSIKIEKIKKLTQDAREIQREKGLVELSKRTWEKVYRNQIVRRVLTPLLLARTNVVDHEHLRNSTAATVYDAGKNERPAADPSHFEGGVDAELLPPEIQNTEGPTYTFEDSAVVVLRDAYLVGSIPFGVTRSNDLILDTIHFARDCNITNGVDRVNESIARTIESYDLRYVNDALTSPSFLQHCSTELECACLLTSGWNNYGHWLTEHVLKLRAVEEYEAQTGKHPTLILEENPPEYKRQYLDILGYGDNWIEWNDSLARVKDLVLPNYPHPTIENVEWIRSRMLYSDPVELSKSEMPERVYISRRKANKKHVLNEEEVIDALGKYDFHDFVLEDMHILDQAHLFANAELVVGPTGSGFTNLIFSGNTSFIELVPHKVGLSWYRIGKIMGLDHEYLFSETKNVRDIIVDVNDLINRIEQYE